MANHQPLSVWLTSAWGTRTEFWEVVQQQSVSHHCNFCLFQISCKWNLILCSFLSLALLIQRNTFEIHQCYCKYQEFFSQLNFLDRPVCLSIHQFRNIEIAAVLGNGNKIAINIPVQYSYECKISSFLNRYLGLKLLSRKFNFTGKPPNCLQCGCTILHSHQRCTEVPVALHPHQYSVLSVPDGVCFSHSNR